MENGLLLRILLTTLGFCLNTSRRLCLPPLAEGGARPSLFTIALTGHRRIGVGRRARRNGTAWSQGVANGHRNQWRGMLKEATPMTVVLATRPAPASEITGLREAVTVQVGHFQIMPRKAPSNGMVGTIRSIPAPRPEHGAAQRSLSAERACSHSSPTSVAPRLAHTFESSTRTLSL